MFIRCCLHLSVLSSNLSGLCRSAVFTSLLESFQYGLLQAHNIVAQNADLLQQLQSSFQYLLVDEYQDSNPVQVLLLSFQKVH